MTTSPFWDHWDHLARRRPPALWWRLCGRYRPAALYTSVLLGVLLSIVASGCAYTQGSTSSGNNARAVWEPLEARPLHVPTLTQGAPCPAVQAHQTNPTFGPGIGNGPVYAALGSSDGVLPYLDAHHFGAGASGWGGNKVLWYIDPRYSGPVLVRGRQIDGPHGMRFDGGLNIGDGSSDTLQPVLRMLSGQRYGAPITSWDWPNYATETRVQATGCYAYQVDGNGFSQVVIFRVA